MCAEVVGIDSTPLQQKANNHQRSQVWKDTVCVILNADYSLGEKNDILILQFNNWLFFFFYNTVFANLSS